MGHVFMYFLRGSLPWQGLKAATNREKYQKIGEKKQTTAIHHLCDGYPEEFATYLSYCRKLPFEETPDYDYLRALFDRVLHRIGEKDDGMFDWIYIWQEQKRASSARQVREHGGSQRMSKPSYNNLPRDVSQSETGGHRARAKEQYPPVHVARERKKPGFFQRVFCCGGDVD